MRREENGLGWGEGGRGEKMDIGRGRGVGGECKSQEMYIGKREKYETQFKGPNVERKRVITAVYINKHYRVQYNNFDNLMTPTY
jgi:hypothetical protein